MFAIVRPDYHGGSYPELWSHYTIFQALKTAIQLAENGKNGKMEMWKKAEEIGQIRLNKMKVVSPPNHTLIANGAFELARVKINLDKLIEANELVKYGQEILKVCEIPDHPRGWEWSILGQSLMREIDKKTHK